MPAAVGKMLDEYRRLRGESAWDWGLDWRIDPVGTWETLPCRLPVALSRMVVGSPELAAAAQATIDEVDVLRCLCARSCSASGRFLCSACVRGEPPEIRTGEASLSLRDVAATHWLVLDSDSSAPVERPGERPKTGPGVARGRDHPGRPRGGSDGG